MMNHSFLGSATVGERGQVAIPTEARRAYGLEPGEKVLFFAAPKGFGVVMVKAAELSRLLEHLSDKVKSIDELLKQAEDQ